MRGSADFTTMKGFMGDFAVKGEGQEPETMPPDPGSDVTEGAEVDNTDANTPKAANIAGSDNKSGAPSTTMAKDLEEVKEGADKDIADGYVADSQNLPGPGTREEKGFEEFNKMVAKGVVVDTQGMNCFNIREKMPDLCQTAKGEFDSAMNDFSGWMNKGMDDSLVLKEEKNSAPEDEESDEGLTEDPEGVGKTEEESDDTKGEQGGNKSFSESGPSEEKCSGRPKMKGFDTEEKSFLGAAKRGVTRAAKLGKKYPINKPSTMRGLKRGAEKAGKYGKAALKRGEKAAKKGGKAIANTVREYPGPVAAGTAVGVGGTVGGAYMLNRRKKDKGLDSPGVVIQKGFEEE